MGCSIDMKKYNFDDLVNSLMGMEEVDDKEMLEEILVVFGERFDEYYILLNNQYYDDYNSYFNLAKFIDKYFDVEGGSFDILLDCGETVDCNISIYEAEELLGVRLE